MSRIVFGHAPYCFNAPHRADCIPCAYTVVRHHRTGSLCCCQEPDNFQAIKFSVLLSSATLIRLEQTYVPLSCSTSYKTASPHRHCILSMDKLLRGICCIRNRR
eukprot:GHVP01001510.1.p1 GENE.GHVP01001510.1~~GHVP01001510.1.p1  ORF type:complete len:104 (-),score=0.44 GHVP01001510.1:57-368(-)